MGLLVCDPRKNALLKVGNKSDLIDARKLAELLRSNLLRSVYHEDTGLRTLKELAKISEMKRLGTASKEEKQEWGKLLGELIIEAHARATNK